MNATEQARAAYASAYAPIRSSRSTEYQVFSDITARLHAASVAGDAGFPQLAAALHDNRMMWTILAADVADSDNLLTKPLRAQIFYLAEFTDSHSRKVLRGEAAVSALIDINTAMMRGLIGQTAAGVV